MGGANARLGGEQRGYAGSRDTGWLGFPFGDRPQVLRHESSNAHPVLVRYSGEAARGKEGIDWQRWLRWEKRNTCETLPRREEPMGRQARSQLESKTELGFGEDPDRQGEASRHNAESNGRVSPEAWAIPTDIVKLSLGPQQTWTSGMILSTNYPRESCRAVERCRPAFTPPWETCR